MRKIVIVALVVLGAAITGDAQDRKNGLQLPPGSTVNADRAQSSGGDVLFAGNVALSIPGATVTADRVTFRQSSQTFELDGHVQLKVIPQPR